VTELTCYTEPASQEKDSRTKKNPKSLYKNQKNIFQVGMAFIHLIIPFQNFSSLGNFNIQHQHLRDNKKCKKNQDAACVNVGNLALIKT